jgi:hypothetical protein
MVLIVMLTKMKFVSDAGESKPIPLNCACVQSRTRLFSWRSHSMCAVSLSAAMPATACAVAAGEPYDGSPLTSAQPDAQ